MYVCLCRAITDSQIRQAVQAGKTEFRQLRQALDVGSQCGKCVRMTLEIIAAEVEREAQCQHSPLYHKVA